MYIQFSWEAVNQHQLETGDYGNAADCSGDFIPSMPFDSL